MKKNNGEMAFCHTIKGNIIVLVNNDMARLCCLGASVKIERDDGEIKYYVITELTTNFFRAMYAC